MLQFAYHKLYLHVYIQMLLSKFAMNHNSKQFLVFFLIQLPYVVKIQFLTSFLLVKINSNNCAVLTVTQHWLVYRKKKLIQNSLSLKFQWKTFKHNKIQYNLHIKFALSLYINNVYLYFSYSYLDWKKKSNFKRMNWLAMENNQPQNSLFSNYSCYNFSFTIIYICCLVIIIYIHNRLAMLCHLVLRLIQFSLI